MKSLSIKENWNWMRSPMIFELIRRRLLQAQSRRLAARLRIPDVHKNNEQDIHIYIMISVIAACISRDRDQVNYNLGIYMSYIYISDHMRLKPIYHGDN